MEADNTRDIRQELDNANGLLQGNSEGKLSDHAIVEAAQHISRAQRMLRSRATRMGRQIAPVKADI